MTPLLKILKSRIHAKGPLSIAEYMKTALLHPTYGYYQQGDTFGAEGDFITAPEISQMFGELVGLWCVDCWVKLGSPSNFHLVELGPGNGTLMSDALRSAALVPDFLDAAQIHLVEASTHLQKIQQEKLSAYPVQWHDTWPNLVGNFPYIVLGNEFLDALPIHQYECVDNSWKERQIDWDDNRLQYCLSDLALSKLPDDIPASSTCEAGSIFEHNPEAQATVSQIAKTITINGGCALFIDYGPSESNFGDSFQSVQRHRYVDPLTDPGACDLTAHVDFMRLSHLAKKQNCHVAPISTQGRFLERLGIEARALTLSKKATELQKDKITADLRRLVSTSEMGTMFKALSFFSKMSHPPAGFSEQ